MLHNHNIWLYYIVRKFVENIFITTLDYEIDLSHNKNN